MPSRPNAAPSLLGHAQQGGAHHRRPNSGGGRPVPGDRGEGYVCQGIHHRFRQSQLLASYLNNDYYSDALKLIKLLMDNLDKINSYISRGDNERSTSPGKRIRRQEPGLEDHGGTCNNKMFQKY